MSKSSIVEFFSGDSGHKCGYCGQEDSNLSRVEYRSWRGGYRCGYCGSHNTKVSHGMWAHSMTVLDYQDLIDRGWRRSGKYCYKPTMNKTCCPQYTIKCNVTAFKLSKSQKKVLKKVNKYLNTGVKPGNMDTEDGASEPTPCQDVPMEKLSTGNTVLAKEVALNKAVDYVHSKQTVYADNSSATKPNDPQEPVSHQPPKQPSYNSSLKGDPSKPNCRKAKEMRRERWQQKHGQVPPTPKNQEGKSLQDFLNEVVPDPALKLELRLVQSSPRSKEFEKTFTEAYRVYKKYQMIIHNDPEDKPTERQYTRFLVDSPLQVRLVRSGSQEFERTFTESFTLYKHYQMIIHKEPASECDCSMYRSFLVDSPLQHEKGALSSGYGSFHQQYWLEGKLIAVGVIDILPHCVSSVYLFYDPDYSFLSLGSYSALREIDFTLQLSKRDPSLVNYYMGFYIHSCPKMRYKGQYHPSYLLCPETYAWFPIEKCRPLLDASKYSRFDETGKGDAEGSMELDRVLVLHMRQGMPYAIYKALNADSNDEEEVTEYVSLVGKTCAQRILLYRD